MEDNIQNKSSNMVNKLLNYYISTLNFEQDVGNFLRQKTNTPRLYSNDLRHQYASAITAQQLGQLPAKLLGNFNEIVHPGLQDDTKIDQYNNQIGRQYAMKYPYFSKQQYLEKFFNDADIIRQQRKKDIGF